MNRLTTFLCALALVCAPANLLAQDDSEAPYLSGAVPLTNGKVVFSKEYSIPGMSQSDIFERIQNWMTERLKSNNNANSRVVFIDTVAGSIAGLGEEWMVFSSSALSLDRTLINYQLTATCQPEKCTIEVEKIRYTYREKEKYTAEEWITDEYALNKTKTKLIRGLAKWRKKTVDFTDDIFADAAKALSAATNKPQPVVAPVKTVSATSGPVVIAAANTVIATTPMVSTPATNVVATVPAPNNGEMPGYRAISAEQLPNIAQLLATDKLVVAMGYKDVFNTTLMTANGGGAIGRLAGKPVAFCFLTADQPTEQLAKADMYALKIYAPNQTEASIIIECKKLTTTTPATMYVGEIVKAWIK